MCIPWPFLRLSSHLVPLLLLLLLFFIYFFFLFFVRGAAAARQRDSETSDDEWTERRVVAPYKADRSKETTSLAADCRKIAFPHYDEIKVSSYIAVLTPSPLPLPSTLSTHRATLLLLLQHRRPLSSKFTPRDSYIRTAINRRRSWPVVSRCDQPRSYLRCKRK